MNHCNLQHAVSSSLVYPKPRRVGVLSNNVTRPFRLLHSSSSQSGAADVCGDSKAGADLLDIIIPRNVSSLPFKEEQLSGVTSSSPPFFLGSPPSRASNPLAQDARFGDEKLNPVSPSLSPFLPSPSRVKGGGCGLVKFGIKPASVRVEGFDCLNRDRQSSSIPALA